MRKHWQYKAFIRNDSTFHKQEKDCRIRPNPGISFPLCPSVFIIVKRETNEAIGRSVFKALLQFKGIRKERKWKIFYQRLGMIIILKSWNFHLMTMKNEDRSCTDLTLILLSCNILHSKELRGELLKAFVRICKWQLDLSLEKMK